MFLVYHKLNSARHLHREGFLHPLNQLDNSGNELGNLNTAGYIYNSDCYIHTTNSGMSDHVPVLKQWCANSSYPGFQSGNRDISYQFAQCRYQMRETSKKQLFTNVASCIKGIYFLAHGRKFFADVRYQFAAQISDARALFEVNKLRLRSSSSGAQQCREEPIYTHAVLTDCQSCEHVGSDCDVSQCSKYRRT